MREVQNSHQPPLIISSINRTRFGYSVLNLNWTCQEKCTLILLIKMRQRLKGCYANFVCLYDDKMVLTFNYKNGIKHSTFDNMKYSGLDGLDRPEKSPMSPGFSDFFLYNPKSATSNETSHAHETIARTPIPTGDSIPSPMLPYSLYCKATDDTRP